MRFGYVFRETFGNLRRNVMMSSAAILTVAISLALVGGALLVRQGVNNATYRWRGGTELSIYMDAAASEAQIAAVRSELDASPDVQRVTYLDKPAAYEEAQRILASDPDTLASLTVQDMPPSFRVVPTSTELIRNVGDRFENEAGVLSVNYPEEAIKTMLRITNVLQIGFFIVAAVLLASASLLILNTIRIAIFARRREISVMKLVGATNWFIRVPFMLEGLIQGLLGAGIAFVAVLGGRQILSTVAQDPDYLLINEVVVTQTQALGTGFTVLAVGILVGVAGSLVAVHRFLDA